MTSKHSESNSKRLKTKNAPPRENDGKSSSLNTNPSTASPPKRSPANTKRTSSTAVPAGTEILQLTRKIINFDDLQAKAIAVRLKLVEEDVLVQSVNYFRFNNVLCYEDGGHVVLPAPQMCNDEQWSWLKKGVIQHGIIVRKSTIRRIHNAFP